MPESAVTPDPVGAPDPSAPAAPLSRRTVLTGGLALGGGLALAAVAGIGVLPARATEPPLAATTETRTIYTTSFEADEPAWQTTSTSYDATVARTGARSLRYDRSDSSYRVVTMTLPGTPGRVYKLSGYLRAADLSSATQGACIAIESRAADGTFTGGSYSSDVTSSTWTLRSLSFTAPSAVATIKISIYLRSGVTGSAWYDDLTLSVVGDRALRTQLRAPSYRGWLVPGDHSQVDLRAAIGLDEAEWPGWTLTAQITDSGGTVRGQQSLPISAAVAYTFPTASLPTGSHTLTVRLANPAVGEERLETWPITKLATTPATWIDRHRRLIRNGSPFFPLGFYNSGVDATVAAQVAGLGGNTVLSYGALTPAKLDQLASQGLTGIVSLKDYYASNPSRPSTITTIADEGPAIATTVNSLKFHPAVLAWYLSDEQNPDVYADRMVAHYQAAVAADSDHPAFGVEYRDLGSRGGLYQRTADALGKDSYPVHGIVDEDISQPAARAAECAIALPATAAWHVPQALAWGAIAGNSGRFPTGVEFRNMTWQMITEGATGLFWYSLYYLNHDPSLTYAQCAAVVQPTVTEVAGLAPVLLSVDQAPAVTAPTASWLHHTVRRHAGKTYLFAVNHGRTTESASFTVAGATTATVLGESRTITPSGGTFADSFAPLAVHLYEVTT